MDCTVLSGKERGGGRRKGRKRERVSEEAEWCGAAVKDMAA